MLKLKIQKSEIKFGDWNFDELFKDGILKINKQNNNNKNNNDQINKCVIRNFGKLEVKLGNWNFEELFKDGILKINK